MEDKENIEANLKDAGFSEEEIKDFMELLDKSNLCKQCECLAQKRKKLLDKIHTNEKQITCLDYLRYKLEKNEKEK